MPTTEPLDPDDDAEGQLKPIVALASAPAAQPRVVPRAVASAPASQPATPAAPVQHAQPARPAAPGQARHLRTTLRTPGLSLNPRRPETEKATTVAQVRNTPYTDADFQAAWKRYIDENPQDRLVINTMRSHPATRIAGTDVFEMSVDSAPQLELMQEATSRLLDILRGTLQNDNVKLKITAIEGVASPMTWNEREVLADMLRRHPGMEQFIRDLKLTLD